MSQCRAQLRLMLLPKVSVVLGQMHIFKTDARAKLPELVFSVSQHTYCAITQMGCPRLNEGQPLLSHMLGLGQKI